MYINLHNHFYMDSASKIKDAVKKAAQLGQKGFAITDHAHISLAFEFYDECVKNGVKPILGVEFYFCEDAEYNVKNNINDRYHLIALAKNETGFINLIKILNEANENFYLLDKLALVDFKLLEKYSQGLIVTNACVFGALAAPLLKNEREKAENYFNRFQDVFKDDFYIEIGYHYFYDQKQANEKLIALAEKNNKKIIAANDTHYVEKYDWYLQDIIFKNRFGLDTRFNIQGQDAYIKSEEEMLQAGFKKEYLDNTAEIYEKVKEYDPYEAVRKTKVKPFSCLKGQLHRLTLNESFDLFNYDFNLNADIEKIKEIKPVIYERITRLEGTASLPEYSFPYTELKTDILLPKVNILGNQTICLSDEVLAKFEVESEILAEESASYKKAYYAQKLEEAKKLFYLNDSVSAKNILNDVINYNGSAEAYYYSALIQRNFKNYQKSFDYFLKAEEGDFKFMANIYQQQAWNIYNMQGEAEEAYKYIDKAIETQKDFMSVYFSGGMIAYFYKDYERAVSYMRLFTEKTPKGSPKSQKAKVIIARSLKLLNRNEAKS